MTPKWTRRDLLKLAALLPAGAYLGRYEAIAAPYRSKLKISDIQAMALRTQTGNCLIRIITDEGLVGYGEAGSTGPMARARIETMKPLLVGKDPLTIEKHFHNMTSLMHTYMAHIPTISGIDMALWDLAGKITGLPVCVLLGGPFRIRFAMYSHGSISTCSTQDRAGTWAQRIEAMPEGFTRSRTISIRCSACRRPGTPPRSISAQLRKVARAYANAREAVGEEIEIAVHCHNELDTPSAIAVAKAVEPMNPAVPRGPAERSLSEGWVALKRSTRVPILTGEKLELVRGFRPFLDNQAVDIVHPDLAFAGGFTGTRKIADFAALTPHARGAAQRRQLVLTYANAHFGSSIQNFYRSESALGRPTRHVEEMAASNPPVVRKSCLPVPMEPGLGADLNPDFLKKYLATGEQYWGTGPNGAA